MAFVLIGTVSRWELAKRISALLKEEGFEALAVPESGLEDRRIRRYLMVTGFRCDLFAGLWDNDTDITDDGEPLLRRLAEGDRRRILDIFPQDVPDEEEQILQKIRKALKRKK